jgi:hypothetical protein
MGVDWQPLSSGQSKWHANLASLRAGNPALAKAVECHKPISDHVLSKGGPLQIGLKTVGGVQWHPNSVTASSARDILRRLYPHSQCTEPLMVAGLDQGWLWQAAYDLPCNTPLTPGHRPPLYFLARDLERFWVVLHLHDWSKLLADPRVKLFVGTDAVEQCQRSMIENTHIPWAKLCVTVDPALWPTNVSVDSLWQTAHQAANTRMHQLSKQIETMYAGCDVKSIIRRLRGETMRVMGITSHYTTFLKYSMGDWLQAFDAMGHQTLLVKEAADHEVTNPVYFGQAIVDFKPDLILMIDHYRAEIAGLPRQIPCVMWVQDNLPNIFSAKAGSAQGPRDFCLGFGRLQMRDRYGYPEQRFMPAQVGVNEMRFAPQKLTQSDLDIYSCDISFVSHASAPATALLTEQINRADAMGRKLLLDVFEQMRAVYDAGQVIAHASMISQMIEQALEQQKIQIDQPSKQTVFDFFNNRINNAFFRHQALTWAAEGGAKLHIWGRGWEHHPRFAKYAKGVACNHSQLCKIYQASKINLQVTPFGAVHQRLLDGLAAGGFFLIRYTPGDLVEPIYKEIYEWCMANGVEDDDQLRERATPEIQQSLHRVHSLLGVSPFEMWNNFFDVLRLSHDGNYIRSAASVWREYGQVSFATAAQLQERAKHFLTNDAERTRISAAMRRAVIERLSYGSISRRLLEFIADDLQQNQLRKQELAA